LRGALANAPYQIGPYHGYLQTILFPDPAVQHEFREVYIHKYRDRRPDLIIAPGPSALKFLVERHEKCFRDIAIRATTPLRLASPQVSGKPEVRIVRDRREFSLASCER
jgi:hypothetical protein